jgi:hypothetical protein
MEIKKENAGMQECIYTALFKADVEVEEIREWK